MKRLKRTSGFTILELTLAMLLSAIVTGITYSVYKIISHEYQVFNIKNSLTADMARLNHLLRKDFMEGDQVIQGAKGLEIHVKDHIVNYEFSSDRIIRTSGITDTFKFKTENLSYFFREMPVETVNQNIDTFSFGLVMNNESYPFTFHKTYSSEELFNTNEHAGN